VEEGRQRPGHIAQLQRRAVRARNWAAAPPGDQLRGRAAGRGRAHDQGGVHPGLDAARCQVQAQRLRGSGAWLSHGPVRCDPICGYVMAGGRDRACAALPCRRRSRNMSGTAWRRISSSTPSTRHWPTSAWPMSTCCSCPIPRCLRRYGARPPWLTRVLWRGGHQSGGGGGPPGGRGGPPPTQAAGEAQMYDRLASVFCLLEDCVAQGVYSTGARVGCVHVTSASTSPGIMHTRAAIAMRCDAMHCVALRCRQDRVLRGGVELARADHGGGACREPGPAAARGQGRGRCVRRCAQWHNVATHGFQHPCVVPRVQATSITSRRSSTRSTSSSTRHATRIVGSL
jgi:hypothetical protein